MIIVPANNRIKILKVLFFFNCYSVVRRDYYHYFLNTARELKEKTMEHESGGDMNCNWCAWNNLQGIAKGTEIFENKRTS